MMRATILLMFSTKYLCAGVQRKRYESAVRTDARIRSGLQAARRLLLRSSISGHSVTSCIVALGAPKIEHSS